MRSGGVCASTRKRRSGTVRVVEMASVSRLPILRQRSSSSTSSLENHGEEDGLVKLQGEMDEEDLEFGSLKKRMRSVMSLQACATKDEAQESAKIGGDSECELEEELAEGTNPDQLGLRSLVLSVSNMSTDVIGALVPRKARSACVKRSLQEYPVSGCHNHQPNSDLEADENGVRTDGCKCSMEKCSNLSSSVDKDIEMEVAEVLLSLVRQSHQPENARDSQQGLGATLVRELEHINDDVKLWPGKNKPEQVGKTGGLELKLFVSQKLPVRLENAETSIMKDGLVKESKKEKSLSVTSFSLSFDSGNSVDMKENQMPRLAEYRKRKLEFDFMRTKEKNKTHMADITLGKLENSLQPRKVYQDGCKRCDTHYYIAQSIMHHRHHQCNKINFISSTEGSALSSVNGSAKTVVNERQLQGLILNENVSSKLPKLTNPTCPPNKDAATETSCLANSAQRGQHLNHKSLQVSSSEKKVCQMLGPKVELSGTHSVSSNSLKPALPMKNTSAAGDMATCSTLLKMDPSMTFYNLQQATNEGPPFMTITPSNDHAFPTSTAIGNSASFKGSVHGNGMPYFNGTVCPPLMFYPQLLNQQPTHPQTLILPTCRSDAGLSRPSSFDKQPHRMQQHGLNVNGHKFLQSAATRSDCLRKNDIHSFRYSHKLEVETPDRNQLVENSVYGDQRSAQNQHSQAAFQQMHFTRTPMVATNSNARKFVKQELVQGPKVESELPASQPITLSYSPYDGSSDPSAKNFSSSGQNYPFLPSPADVAHQRYFGSQIAGLVYKNYQVGAQAGVDFTRADRGKNASSCLIQSPAMSKEIPYDHTAMLKGCSIFDKSAKTPSFYEASKGANSQSHYAQGVWNKTSTTNAQLSSAMSTNVPLPYTPLIMSHPAHWSNSNLRGSQFPQSASTLPTFSYSPSYLVPQSSTSGGNNDNSIPAQVNGMSVMHPPPTLANITHSPSTNSSRPEYSGIQSGSVVLPNGASPNSSSQQKLSSPVCRMVLPSILTTCPSQVSEVKN